MKTLVQSEKYCQDIVLKRAKNFSFALKPLPKIKRRALYAIYAFARLADDIADDDLISINLETLQKDLDEVYQHGARDSYSWHASLAQAIRQFSLPKKYFDELLLGMKMDTENIHFKTWQETHEYCYLAASTIGLLCLEVFGYSDPTARRYAKELGIAMQLTNILRDLREDYSKGRQYLPEEDFSSFSIEFKNVLHAQPKGNVLSFMLFQIDRVKVFFESSQNLFPLIDKDARFCPKALSLIYSEYLKILSDNPLASIKGSLKISTAKKLFLTAASRFS